jgi:hypothetical protein
LRAKKDGSFEMKWASEYGPDPFEIVTGAADELSTDGAIA